LEHRRRQRRSKPLHAAFIGRGALAGARGTVRDEPLSPHDRARAPRGPPPPSALPPSALAWRQTLRDFRAGELRLLAVAVMLAVAALTAVGFFADRLNTGLARDARQLLGGDAVVGSDKPAPPELAAKARSLGLAVATSAGFPSMGRAPDDKGGASRLVAVKAVSARLPAARPAAAAARARRPVQAWPPRPAPGTVWVDAALLDALQLKVGDPLLLGDAALRIAAHHRHRARPRRRLHELCAARDAGRGRPGRPPA
jgi:putative ABC transport system permease protein